MNANFPANWKLSRVQAALLRRLLEGPSIVSDADLDAVLQPMRHGKSSRPVKVVMHYLRVALKPRGITIRNHRNAGYQLVDSRPSAAPSNAQEAVASQG